MSSCVPHNQHCGQAMAKVVTSTSFWNIFSWSLDIEVVKFCKNSFNFLCNSQNLNPLACFSRWDIGCVLWCLIVIYILLLISSCCIYHLVLDCTVYLDYGPVWVFIVTWRFICTYLYVNKVNYQKHLWCLPIHQIWLMDFFLILQVSDQHQNTGQYCYDLIYPNPPKRHPIVCHGGNNSKSHFEHYFVIHYLSS